MKNKCIAILLLSLSLSLTGCGTQQASVEPTETVIETEEPTETEEIAVETETIIETETEEPVDIYSDEVIGTLAMYDFFEGSTDEEIRQFIKDDEDTQEVLNTHDAEYIDFWMTSLKDLCAGTLYEINHPTTTNNNNATNTNSNSNKGNTKSNNTNSTPSQDTDTTKGYGDAGGNSESEAPVQEIDDGLGSNAEEVSNLWGQHQWSEDTGGRIDLQ